MLTVLKSAIDLINDTTIITVGKAPADGGGGHDLHVLLCETQFIFSALPASEKCLYCDARERPLLFFWRKCFRTCEIHISVTTTQECVTPLLMLKAQGSFGSGRAYAIKQQRRGEYLYVYARVAQSYKNTSAKAYNVMVVFMMPTTDADPNPAHITHALCHGCVRGQHSGWCHHIVALVQGLMQFRMRIINTGQYNFGDRSWGHGRLLASLPPMPTRDIALLFAGQHALRSFPGIKTEFANVVSRYPEYIRFLKRYGTDDMEKTVIEIHHDSSMHPDSAAIREDRLLPTFNLQESFFNDSTPRY